MGSPARKQKKRKDRERRVRQEKIDQARRQLEGERRREYARAYPDFVLEPNNADPEFVELIRGAVGRINFEDESIFARWEAVFYRQVKEHGFTRAWADLEAVMPKLVEQGIEKAQLMDVYILLHLGQAVFDLIPQADLERFIPFNDVEILPRGSRIRVRFKALLRAKGSGGTAYFSPHRPTVLIDGQPKVVAFSLHAMQRVCERIDPDWRNYAGLGDVFGFFGSCVYFETCELYGGQLGFTFYDTCNEEKFWQSLYVEDVLGQDKVDPRAGPCYYRVGYCPAVIEGEFIKAKTFLFPGYAQTPEYGAIRHFARSTEERRQLAEQAKGLDSPRLKQDLDLSIIKWFHDHGVPQVVQMRQPVFVR